MRTSTKKEMDAICTYAGVPTSVGQSVDRCGRWTSSEWPRGRLVRALFVLLTLVICQSTATAVGPTTDPTSTAAIANACNGVQIAPGMSADSIQAAVDSHAAGTVFCFMSGTYVLNHYITLKDSNQVICSVRRSCVLTGLDQYRGAFTAAYGTAHHVIRGFIAEHFITVPNTWPNAALQLRDNGLIDDNETRYNRVGISVNSNQTILNNFIHHNTQVGLSGGPLSNLIIENNDLSFNNTGHFDPNDDASGSKIIGGSQTGSFFVTWRNNHIHDNWGQGIWSDGNVHNALIEGNLIENNWGAGIDHEISWDATIRNNTLRNNMRFELNLGYSCWHGGQIAVTNSQNLSITGNTVEAVGTNAICLANTTRTESSAFPQSLANVSVANNFVKFSGAVSIGVVGDTPPSGISFSGNTYYIDVLTNRDWNFLGLKTWQQWQAAGQDTTGKLLALGSAGTPPAEGTPPTSGGALAGSGVASFAAVNLTTSGTGDWAKWPSYIHKASGGSQISNFTKIGAPSVQTYNNDLRPISWTGGTPTATGTNDTSGVFIGGIGNGFQLSAPADTKSRTLLVYVGGWVSGGKLVAHLSDGSAADFVNTSFSSTTGQYKLVYTLTYHAASAGQRLVVQWTQASGTGNVTLQAAALQ